MTSYHARFHQCLRVATTAAALTVIGLLSGCTNGDSPNTPKTPKTGIDMGYYTTTHMDVPTPPARTSPGMM
jgi:hypothetical protein